MNGERALANAGRVAIKLEPAVSRQLGEEGVVVFWRDGLAGGRREGLVGVLSLCSLPACPCGGVHVRGFVVDDEEATIHVGDAGVFVERSSAAGGGIVRLHEKLRATVEPSSGIAQAREDDVVATSTELLTWFMSELDGEALEALHRFESRARGRAPEGPRSDIDVDELESCDLAWVDDVLDGTREDEYVLSGNRYWAAVYLCPAPWCDCHDAEVVFFDASDESEDMAGVVALDISGPSGFQVKELVAEGSPAALLEELWALFQRRHDVGSYLRRREAQIREVGATLWDSDADVP